MSWSATCSDHWVSLTDVVWNRTVQCRVLSMVYLRSTLGFGHTRPVGMRLGVLVEYVVDCASEAAPFKINGGIRELDHRVSGLREGGLNAYEILDIENINAEEAS